MFYTDRSKLTIKTKTDFKTSTGLGCCVTEYQFNIIPTTAKTVNSWRKTT